MELSRWLLLSSNSNKSPLLRLWILTQLSVLVEMAFFPSVLWTTTNDKFSTKCCCPGESPGLFIKVPPSSKLYIVCPSEAIIFQKQESNVPSDLLHDNCIMVDETGYEKCRYDPTNSPSTNKIVQNCTHNAKGPLQFRRLVFDKISIFDDLVFEPGRNYSFISTSDGTKDSLTNNQGPGRCNDAKNHLAMKMKVYVCKEDEDCGQPNYINLCEDKCLEDKNCHNVRNNLDYCRTRLKRCDDKKGANESLAMSGRNSPRKDSELLKELETSRKVAIAGWTCAAVGCLLVLGICWFTLFYKPVKWQRSEPLDAPSQEKYGTDDDNISVTITPQGKGESGSDEGTTQNHLICGAQIPTPKSGSRFKKTRVQSQELLINGDRPFIVNQALSETQAPCPPGKG